VLLSAETDFLMLLATLISLNPCKTRLAGIPTPPKIAGIRPSDWNHGETANTLKLRSNMPTMCGILGNLRRFARRRMDSLEWLCTTATKLHKGLKALKEDRGSFCLIRCRDGIRVSLKGKHAFILSSSEAVRQATGRLSAQSPRRV
jgi:hypothetical protein